MPAEKPWANDPPGTSRFARKWFWAETSVTAEFICYAFGIDMTTWRKLEAEAQSVLRGNGISRVGTNTEKHRVAPLERDFRNNHLSTLGHTYAERCMLELAHKIFQRAASNIRCSTKKSQRLDSEGDHDLPSPKRRKTSTVSATPSSTPANRELDWTTIVRILQPENDFFCATRFEAIVPIPDPATKPKAHMADFVLLSNFITRKVPKYRADKHTIWSCSSDSMKMKVTDKEDLGIAIDLQMATGSSKIEFELVTNNTDVAEPSGTQKRTRTQPPLSN